MNATHLIRKWGSILLTSFCAGEVVGQYATELAVWIVFLFGGAIATTLLVDYLENKYFVEEEEKEQDGLLSKQDV